MLQVLEANYSASGKTGISKMTYWGGGVLEPLFIHTIIFLLLIWKFVIEQFSYVSFHHDSYIRHW